MKLISFLFLLSILVCLAGCEKPVTEIAGDVFITTRGAESVKLGGLELVILPLKDAKAFLHEKEVADIRREQGFEWHVDGFARVNGVRTVKTDSDGKFTIKLPPGEYAVLATAERELVNVRESYKWLVKLDAKGEQTRLVLTGSNMANSLSGESLIYKTWEDYEKPSYRRIRDLIY